MFGQFGIDLRKEPVLIYPTLHYQNGGIEISADGQSGVENLFIAGEAVGGIHGKNRLMGNSLLDIIVFGRNAGQQAAARSKTAEAVESFQRVHDLSMVDGKVGPGTWRTLYKVLDHSAAGAGGNAWNTSTAYLFSRTYSGEGRVMIIKSARANI